VSTASPDELLARALFDEGRALRDAGRIDAACDRFEAAKRRFASAGVEFNLGDCYAKLGRSASAWSAFREAALTARQTHRADISSAAERAASELEPRLTRLAIQVPHAVPGLTLKRDGVNVFPMSFGAGVAVDPGTHEVRAEAPGREPWSTSVNVSTLGETVTLEVPELRSTAPVEVAPAAAPVPASAHEQVPRPVARRDTGASSGLAPEWAWIDADIGGAYAYAAEVNTTSGSHRSGVRSGPTFSAAAGVRLSALTLGFRARNVDLPTFNVWEMDGDAAGHIRLDRFDGHVGLRVGYAFVNAGSGTASNGLNVGVFFGFDYYLSSAVSLGVDVSPELIWLSADSQAGVSLGAEAVARLGAHF
jgi:hypothetical protein